MRVYIQELLPAPGSAWDDTNGFLTWFQASCSGHVVDNALLMLLEDHYRSMHAYDLRVQASGKSGAKTPYWALSNPTVPSETSRRVSSKDKEKEGQSKSIIPMRSLIPDESQITDDFLRAHRIPAPLKQTLLEQEEILDAWRWSIEESEYLEGVKARPTGNSSSNAAVSVAGVVVAEEHPTPPAPAPTPEATPPPPLLVADPAIDAMQVLVLQMLCQQDEARLLALCQQYQVASLAQLRTSQFPAIVASLTVRPS